MESGYSRILLLAHVLVGEPVSTSPEHALITSRCHQRYTLSRGTMVVRAGREFLAIPGPTTMPDEVLRAMHRPSVDIYAEALPQLTASLLADMKKLFSTEGHTYIYIANGHGTWEAALTNVLSRGDKILVLESGRFALGWGEAAKRMKVDVEILKGSWNRAVRPDEVEARLKADSKGEI